MKQLTFFLLIFAALQAGAQTPKHRVVSIPVKTGNKQLKFPWTGGMNAPQFSPCDLNNDGIKDLFVFDRVGNSVLTYINLNNSSDTTFQYAPQYETLFPRSLEHWAIIRDYNNDGIPDIFSRAIYYNGEPYVGSRVLKGKIENGHLAFDVVRPILNYFSDPYHVNIWTNIDDIPAYTDVNRDGDIDILTFGIFGAAVEYYENQTMENAGNAAYAIDSFKYLQSTACWGEFREAGLTNSIAMNISCKGGSDVPDDGGGARHTGSTLYSFDADNDHDTDLLLGDVSFNNLVYVQNCGDSSYAQICSWDSLWPACNTPTIIPIFPAAYGIDVDNDGKEDVVAAPNARQGAMNHHNAQYYRNVQDTGCQFQLQSDTFLVHHSLDFGTASKPVFFDYNGDGLKDLIVGNFGYFRPFTTYKSALAVYENTGTSSTPKFELITDDYKNYSALGLISMYPAFGDLDNDGKQDMIIGDHTGALHFFKNTGAGNQANFPANATVPTYYGIDVGQYASPFIYDVNGDALNDLIVGKRDGEISYFWNFGTPDSAVFHMDSVNDYFGHIRVNEGTFIDGYATPVIVKDSADNMFIYSGSERGYIYKYLVNPANLRSGAFQLVDSDFLKFPLGAESAIAINDLNNDGLMEYVCGNARGGLVVYSESVWDTAAQPVYLEAIEKDDVQMRFYPNPAADYMVCEITGNNLVNPVVEVYSMLGQKETAPAAVNGNKIGLNTSGLSAGVYFVKVSSGGKVFTGKFLVK